MNQRMYAKVLGARQLKLLKAVSMAMTHAGLYLAGDTAVALNLGHRHSIDLDFFSSQSVQPEIIADLLNTHAKFETKSVSAGTLHGLANSVKVSVIEYRYPIAPAKSLDGTCPATEVAGNSAKARLRGLVEC
jgi:hypothetical protein